VSWLIYGALAYFVYKMATGEKKESKDSKPASKKKPEPSGPPPHEVLGVSADASEEEIRRAYQDKMRQYHPDRVASAAPELQALAEKRSKEINAAYRTLMDRV
jgi:DnaJ-class molecular chaperone